MQLIHMPLLHKYKLWEPMPDDKQLSYCWTVNLNLPSSINVRLRDGLCPNGLADKEYLLRFAQAQDSLDEIRLLLQMQWGLLSKKKRRASGPGQKINSLVISGLRERQELQVDRYRRAREALATLRPRGDWEKVFKDLRDEDIRPVEDDEGVGRSSWIWVTNGAVACNVDSNDIHEGM